MKGLLLWWVMRRQRTAAVMLEMRFAYSARDFADRTLRPRSAAASLVDQNHTLPPYKIPITRMGTLYGG